MCVDVLACGGKTKGEKFRYWTRTISVSAHGGVLVLDGTLMAGQTLRLMNEYSLREAECRVVSAKRGRDGTGHVAFEFVSGGENFWSMTFPPSGAKPLRRMAGKRE